MSIPECYHVLELTNDANLDDVKQAYRRQAMKFHPDSNEKKKEQESLKMFLQV